MPSLSKRIVFCATVLIAGAILGMAGAMGGGNLSNQPLRFTILYDNYLHKEGTRPDWGFSCLIQGTEKTILFDTGTDPKTLRHNIDALGVDLKKVDQIVISHDHGDHTGGLTSVLEKNHDVTVYYPVSFPTELVRRIERLGAKAQAVDRPVEICRDVFLTGEMGDMIREQSLIIDTARELIVVTGCSHPGIVNILERAREIRDRPIRLICGGFHLGERSKTEMQKIIAGLRDLKVEQCGATHCTGDAQLALFKEAFGRNYVPMGTGRVIEFAAD